MKKIFAALLMMIPAVMIALSLPCSAREVDIYLLGGQSNMQGIGKITALGEDAPRTIPHTYFFTGADFEPLVLGETRTSTRAGELGPEIGFALEVASRDRPIYLVKYHQSGMPLHHGWNGGTWVGGDPASSRRNFYPGIREGDENQGVLYGKMLIRYRMAIRKLEEDGHTPVIKGFVWMQGEQDSKHEESATAYAANLKRLQLRLGEDLGVRGNLPMVYGQVLPHEPAAARFTHRNEIRKQMAFADGESSRKEAIPNARMVSTDTISLRRDKVHYDARGQLQLGRDFGRALKELLTSFAAPKQQPNVVLIIADDLGYADMGFLPQAPADVKRFGTPGFDRLAETGTYFKNAYSTSPICSPSRAGLITGRYQQRWGNYWYGQGGLPQRELTIPEALRTEGYTTVKFGKTHLNGGPKEFPTLHGFDQFLGFMHHTWDYIRLSHKDVEAYRGRESFKGFGCQVVGPLLEAKGAGTTRDQAGAASYENSFTTTIFTDRAANFIEKQPRDKPFYLHLSYNAVHQPTYVVEKSWAKKVGARYVPWDRDAVAWEYPYWEPEKEPHKVFHKKWGHMGKIDPEGRRCYLANLLALDHAVSRLLDVLEATGQRDNTLVVFVSDNGGTINTYANNTPLNGYKYMFGEGGIRIPMLVSMPGTLPQGRVNPKAIVSAMDIFPTILDLAGLEIPDNLDGMSLVPLLKGERDNHHPWLAWAKSRSSWVLRKGPWKLAHKVGWNHRDFALNDRGDCVPADKKFSYPNGVLLFNLEKDIGETTNLAADRPEIVEQLKALYASWDSQMAGPCRPGGTPKK